MHAQYPQHSPFPGNTQLPEQRGLSSKPVNQVLAPAYAEISCQDFNNAFQAPILGRGRTVFTQPHSFVYYSWELTFPGTLRNILLLPMPKVVK